ncbi:MAG: TonB-dependent receptor plug domain-containing protein, partial [Comamonas sp.]
MPALQASRPIFHPVAQAVRLAVLGCALAVGAVHAASPAAAVPMMAQSYQIAAGPLGRALAEVAAASGVALSFDPALTQGLNSPALVGSFTPHDALKRLLAGSKLNLVQRSDGSYSLQRQPAAPVSREEGSLAEVQVTAQAERSGATEGTGSYTQTGPSRTATGLGLSLRETPQSVSVMTRQRMDDFKLETLTDVLEQTPGIGVYRQNNATDFQARGSTVNLQVDGMAQLTNGWYFVTSTMYALDDMAEMDRVEVLKGSSGLVVGKGGYGATVNMVRKRPTREFQASVRANVGSWDTY